MPAAHRILSAPLSATVLVLGLVLSGCASPDASPTAAATATTTSEGPSTVSSGGHGYVEGAAEMSEPQLRLVVVDPLGSTTGIDLLTGGSVDLPDLNQPTAVTTDGRYLFATSANGLTILDSGVWTVPHGDHSHYYLSEARLVGELSGSAEMRVSSAPSLAAAVDPATRVGTVLDGAELGLGAVVPVVRIGDVPTGGLLVPLGDHLVQTTASSAGAVADVVRVLDPAGAPVAGSEVPCPAATGTITTRVGVVIGCSDGAVLAVAGPGAEPTVALEHIPYPDTVLPDDRAQQFRARKDRPVVAALAGDRGAWILDTRKQQWKLLPTDTALIAVTAVDNGDHAVVAVDRDGRILVMDAESGAVTGRTEPLLAASTSDPRLQQFVTIEVDAARAYVNDPAGLRVLEIDHGAAGRVSREFPTATMPMFLAEVGR